MDMTMLSNIEILSIVVSGIAGCYLLAAFGWSITFPERRIWPPKQATTGIKLRVWLATISIYVATFVLGIADWNSFDWPVIVRWGVVLLLLSRGMSLSGWGSEKSDLARPVAKSLN